MSGSLGESNFSDDGSRGEKWVGESRFASVALAKRWQTMKAAIIDRPAPTLHARSCRLGRSSVKLMVWCWWLLCWETRLLEEEEDLLAHLVTWLPTRTLCASSRFRFD